MLSTIIGTKLVWVGVYKLSQNSHTTRKKLLSYSNLAKMFLQDACSFIDNKGKVC